MSILIKGMEMPKHAAVDGYRVMYNDEKLYTVEKDGIVILVHGVAKYDAVQRAKQALEKLLLKERENSD